MSCAYGHCVWQKNWDVTLNCHILLICLECWRGVRQRCGRSCFGLKTQLRPAGQGSFQMFKGLQGSSFLFASGLVSQKGASCWPWSQNRKRCHGTTLTDTGVSSFKPRASCCNWSQIAFSLKPDCVYTCAHVYVCLPWSPSHVSVYVGLSLFRIADKCQSLCLASLCMRTQWLGLQAVVQD